MESAGMVALVVICVLALKMVLIKQEKAIVKRNFLIINIQMGFTLIFGQLGFLIVKGYKNTFWGVLLLIISGLYIYMTGSSYIEEIVRTKSWSYFLKTSVLVSVLMMILFVLGYSGYALWAGKKSYIGYALIGVVFHLFTTSLSSRLRAISNLEENV